MSDDLRDQLRDAAAGGRVPPSAASVRRSAERRRNQHRGTIIGAGGVLMTDSQTEQKEFTPQCESLLRP